MSIIGFKWHIDFFFKESDLGLWKVKMKAVLTRDKCIKVLLSEALMYALLTQAEKTEMVDKVVGVIMLCIRKKF